MIEKLVFKSKNEIGVDSKGNDRFTFFWNSEAFEENILDLRVCSLMTL